MIKTSKNERKISHDIKNKNNVIILLENVGRHDTHQKDMRNDDTQHKGFICGTQHK